MPKFYFIKNGNDSFLVEDGQQRLNAIYEFFSNDLPLSDESSKHFGGARFYRDLPSHLADQFDDFEIEYDVIEGATDPEHKEFFQRLQAGAPLNASEKLNAVPSKLRDFCRERAKDKFFKEKIAIPDTRFAYFDILAKVMAIEVEGLETGLRLDDVKAVFEHQAAFSTTSAAAKRVDKALGVLNAAFPTQEKSIRTRTAVQSLITLTCRLVDTGNMKGQEVELRKFVMRFFEQLSKQVELGQNATDSDYIRFQNSVNANVRTAARTRHEIMLRKLFTLAPGLASLFDPSIVVQAGLSQQIKSVGESITNLIAQCNEKYAAKNGSDFFKPTNKTVQAQNRLKNIVTDLNSYKSFIDDLYFLVWEGPGSKLGQIPPVSFVQARDLRTYLRHDVDHGDGSKIKSKKKKLGSTFADLGGVGTPETSDPRLLAVVQSNLLLGVEADIAKLMPTF